MFLKTKVNFSYEIHCVWVCLGKVKESETIIFTGKQAVRLQNSFGSTLVNHPLCVFTLKY